jgi:hypothetical protein
MKKVTPWSSAVLAAMVLLSAGCETATGPETKPGDKNLPGVLTIKVSGDDPVRSLTTGNAKAATHFYEVIFHDIDHDTYARAVWNKGQTVRLAVPPAIYDGGTGSGHGQAILLAGTSNVGTAYDYTLLAVGYLTNVDSGGGTSTIPVTNITVDSQSVTFTLFALNAAPSLDAADTSFKITGGVGVTPTPSTGTLPNATVSGGTDVPVPYFQLPKSATATATYTINELSAQQVGPSGPVLGSFLRYKTGKVFSVGVVSREGDNPVILEDTSVITNSVGSDLLSGVIGMTLETNGADGLTVLFFDAEVTGLAVNVPHGLAWHLRGGTVNYRLDTVSGAGPKTDTAGAGILLAVGTPNVVSPTIDNAYNPVP